jgi:hypothetical protein
LNGPINPHGDVVHDLRMHPSQREAFTFERGRRRLLIIEAPRFLSLLPGLTSFRQQLIVQPATLL